MKPRRFARAVISSMVGVVRVALIRACIKKKERPTFTVDRCRIACGVRLLLLGGGDGLGGLLLRVRERLCDLDVVVLLHLDELRGESER